MIQSTTSQKVLSIVAGLLMLGLGISTVICVIRLQEATLNVQGMQGQITALTAQVKDWQENYAALAKEQASDAGVFVKKMGITLASPMENAVITDAVNVRGYANTFEGNVQLRLKDSTGVVLASGFTTACMGDWPCYFEKELKFNQPEADTDAVLEVYTTSAKDGSEQDLISVKVKIKGKNLTTNKDDKTVTIMSFDYGQSFRPENIPAQNIVFRDEASWRSFWQKHSADPVPWVDFTKSTIIGVFLGVKPSPGYGVKIISAQKNESQIIVSGFEYTENPTCVYPGVVVYPHHLILLPSSQNEVVFDIKKIVADPCNF